MVREVGRLTTEWKEIEWNRKRGAGRRGSGNATPAAKLAPAQPWFDKYKVVSPAKLSPLTTLTTKASKRVQSSRSEWNDGLTL